MNLFRLRHFRIRPRHLMILLLAAVVLTACLVLWAGRNLQGIVSRAASGLGVEVRAARMDLEWAGRLVVADLHVGDFARVGKIDLEWTWTGLLRREVDLVRVHGARIWLGKMQQALERGAVRSGRETGKGFPFTVRKLVVSDSTLVLDNLGAGLPAVPLRVADVPPALVMTNLRLGGDANDPAAFEKQTAEIRHFTIYSPYDPMARVLRFETIRVTFTWAGIQKQEIESVVFGRPTIFIGPDLFWFADEVAKKHAEEEIPKVKPEPWTVRTFRIEEGQLVLAPHGQGELPIPGTFQVSANGLVLDDFANMPLEVDYTTEIPFKNYPEYQLRLKGVRGRLNFNLPLGEGARNLVRTFEIDEIGWKDLVAGGPGNPVWVSMTFQRSGMFAKFGGPAYGGYLNGGVDVYLDREMNWLAYASVSGLDCRPLTELLSPEHFVMRGAVDGNFKVRGRSREVVGLGGRLTLPEGGRMEVRALDGLVEQLPAEWPLLKRELARVPMEAFRTYDYTGGSLEFAYAWPTTFLRMDLAGLQGARRFDIRWNDLRPEPLSLFIPPQTPAAP